MHAPLVVRPRTDAEHDAVTVGLGAADACILRRFQIAEVVGSSDQAVRDALHAVAARGTAARTRQSSRPKTTPPAFDAVGAARLRALLHRRPRDVGRERSVWTRALVAAVSVQTGLTADDVSGETVRATLARLGMTWQRAKRWIASPDPAYARKKASATV
ncbi:MAG: helix-turn-helix domain-containing protein [Chloroflexia bacterium]|nr:helix-turn-helix domain-containing protein [Chloroflexia bacterium]